jgi:hypothetical protein
MPVSSPSGNAAWYTFPRVDNMGSPDPYGGFPKPDSNIQIPAMYPVTALLSGTVTAIDTSNVSWGGAITIALDNPLNSLATHTAYIHLGAETVAVGQHVYAGQLIGYNGDSAAQGTQKVPLGFALYNGDHYGFGTAWQYETYANVTGLLSPVSLLNSAKNGTLSTSLGNYSGGAGASNAPLQPTKILPFVTTDAAIQNAINNVPGFAGVIEALDVAEQFQPLQLQQTQADIQAASTNTDYTIFGIDTGISNPFADISALKSAITLPADAMQAFIVFIAVNTRAALIRAFLIFIGLVILVAVLQNVLHGVQSSTGMSASNLVNIKQTFGGQGR